MATYASKYYDPDKAHEYYMKTRELKGYENRYGGSRGDGTSAASTSGYVSEYQKKQESNKAYNTGVKTKATQSKTSYNNKVSQLKDTTSKAKQQTTSKINGINNQIKNLQERLKNMSREEKERWSIEIKDQIFELREKIKDLRESQRDYNNTTRLQIRNLKQQQADEAQRLRQQQKGGSTSGFNEKGKEAAAYIKQQMETERDETIKKINAETDSKMLDQVKSFAERIKQIRAGGQKYDTKKFLAQTKSLLGKVKKTKTKTAREQKDAYRAKYIDEIDKLRLDDSMWSYWDKREEKLKAQDAADTVKNNNEIARKKQLKASKEARVANRDAQREREAASITRAIERRQEASERKALAAQRKAEREAAKDEKEAKKTKKSSKKKKT